MANFISGNVLGVVIAPRGTEDLPKGKRFLVWRVMVRPLVEEVAVDQELPVDDIAKVVRQLQDYCIAEGIALTRDDLVSKE